jgi:hypothetical protein
MRQRMQQARPTFDLPGPASRQISRGNQSRARRTAGRIDNKRWLIGFDPQPSLGHRRKHPDGQLTLARRIVAAQTLQRGITEAVGR